MSFPKKGKPVFQKRKKERNGRERKQTDDVKKNK